MNFWYEQLIMSKLSLMFPSFGKLSIYTNLFLSHKILQKIFVSLFCPFFSLSLLIVFIYAGNHTRSEILTQVSKYNMKEFMELPSSEIIESLNAEHIDSFYES